LRHAIVVLGSDRLRCLILTTALQSFSKAPLRSKDFRAWWHHSLATALLSEAFAKVSRQDCPEAYMSGLLHDVGRLALILQVSRDRWRSFVRSAEAPSRAGMSILDVERELFGVDHCTIGERLLREWGLPEELVDAARLHHSIDGACLTNPTLIVAAACEMSSALGFEALQYPRTRTIADLVPLLPAHARPLLATDPEKLRAAVKDKIMSLDSAM
jgi:putative nucleotidyltransferase with HDIG domain